MFVVMIMVMAVMMVVAVGMTVFVRRAADFYVVAAETASAFFAHKILFCSGGL